MTKNLSSCKFECALGCHDYCVPNKERPKILMCTCGRKGYRKGISWEEWYDFDLTGKLIHIKDSHSYEMWLNNIDKWMYKKPENWKYEKYGK